MIQINGAFNFRNPEAVCQILNPNSNGVFRVSNSSRDSRILRVVMTFRCLHRIVASAAGFLHYDRLDEQNIVRDTILLRIFPNDRLIGFHLCAERQRFRSVIVLASEQRSATANQNNHYDHQNRCRTPRRNRCVERLRRLRCRPGQLCRCFSGFLCRNDCHMSCRRCCTIAFLYCFDRCLSCFLKGVFCGGIYDFPI